MVLDLAIRVEGLGKQYRIGQERAKYKTLRDALTDGISGGLHAIRMFGSGKLRRKRDEAIVWALRDVSLNMSRGEVVGVIGQNGAGKSTLLKVLSRITEPTVGYAEVHGRIASLLEVGTGFHPELSGRENIFLNGAVLGMRKLEIERRFDEIVSFSEVEKFIDTPVKHYSSGMYLRLAFAVAAHLEPEILLVDEVLAVGDASFQKKCLGKMEDVAREGRTVLFVSHNMSAIRSLCPRAIWLSDGRIAADGEIDEVIQQYLNSLNDGSFSHDNSDYGLVIESVQLKNSFGEEALQFAPADDLIVEVCFEARNRIEKPYILLVIQHNRGTCFTANMLLDGHRPDVLLGRGKLTCRFKSIPLLPQSYTVKLKIIAKNGRDAIMDYRDVASFRVAANLSEYGFRGAFQSKVEGSNPVIVPYEWTLPDGSTANVELKRSDCVASTPEVRSGNGVRSSRMYSSRVFRQ